MTDLSVEKLREWTSRRALIPADVPPAGRGSPARFSWQTILVLRLAITLRERFHLQLQAHASLLRDLRSHLATTSFIALWDKLLVVQGPDRWALIDEGAAEAIRDDSLIVHLDPHLKLISSGFGLASPTHQPGQIDLFPLAPVGGAADRNALTRQALDVGPRRKSA
ncbi:MAG: hypothetical protein Q7T69_20790 [Rhodoferax sp.]|nr:hypothetical protein [Rhodoferax sp.]